MTPNQPATEPTPTVAYAAWDFSQHVGPSIAEIVAPFGPRDFTEALLNTVALLPLEIANAETRVAQLEATIGELASRAAEVAAHNAAVQDDPFEGL